MPVSHYLAKLFSISLMNYIKKFFLFLETHQLNTTFVLANRKSIYKEARRDRLDDSLATPTHKGKVLIPDR